MVVDPANILLPCVGADDLFPVSMSGSGPADSTSSPCFHSWCVRRSDLSGDFLVQKPQKDVRISTSGDVTSGAWCNGYFRRTRNLESERGEGLTRSRGCSMVFPDMNESLGYSNINCILASGLNPRGPLLSLITLRVPSETPPPLPPPAKKYTDEIQWITGLKLRWEMRERKVYWGAWVLNR